MEYDDVLLKAALQVCQGCMGLKQGESLLVVTDSEKRDLAAHFMPVGKSIGVETLVMEMAPRSIHGEEPPAAVSAALKKADAALLITSKSLSHTDARSEATDLGVRVASMPMITADIMKGSLLADYTDIKVMSEAIAAKMTEAKQVLITSPAGTNLRLDVTGRTGQPDTGVLTEKGAMGNLPAGEAYIAPVEGKGDGTLVIDGVMGGVGKVRTPIVITIKDGAAVEITGGEEAEALKRMLGEAGENAFKIAELGIGTNPLATLMDNPLVDEKVYGTAHIAFGDNAHMGGVQHSNIHVDGILVGPTIAFDGKVVVDKGKHFA